MSIKIMIPPPPLTGRFYAAEDVIPLITVRGNSFLFCTFTWRALKQEFIFYTAGVLSGNSGVKQLTNGSLVLFNNEQNWWRNRG